MSQERELSHASNQVQAPPTNDNDLAPGRSSLSAKLEAPAQPLISGLIQRKAERDANGVAEGADAAIATAASSSGMSLPAPIQRKFESSLGADLSNVRVHTGSESQSAASAVGAKAYTTGQDIHFGAGHYDPSSSGGEHLLAHEVAHTVQQQGGTPTRQNKLEVSAPQDAAEHEADRAADAMVVGQAASVSTASGVHRQFLPTPQPQTDFLNNPGGTPNTAKNPTDPYQQPPVSWDVDAVSPPEIPAGWGASSHNAPPVQPRLTADNQLGSIDPADVQVKEEADRMFTRDSLALFDSWTKLVPMVTEFQHAEADIGSNGLGAGAGNLHYNGSGSGNADANQLTGAQKVSSTQTINDLFKGTAMKNDSLHVPPEKQAKIKELHNQVDTAASGVTAELAGVKSAADAQKVGAASMKQAVDLLDIRSKEADKEKAAAQVEELKKAKEKANATVETFVTVVHLVCEVSEGGAGVLDATVEGLGKIACYANNAIYDSQIQDVNNQIKSIQDQINELQKTYVADTFATATAQVAKGASEMVAARLRLKTAVAHYQDAWDTFGREAGQAVGGKDGAQVEAIMKAIPRVELVVGKVRAVKASIAVPSYSDPSGIGFNAVGKPADFQQHVALIKGYDLRFSMYETMWSQRADSLKKMAASLGAG